MEQETAPLFAKARIWASFLGKLPGVKAIFLSGSLACGNATNTSDIDFFIIAKRGQIWTCRAFVFLALKIFGQLAKEYSHAGKICPNHFITDDALEIQEKDPYSAFLFSHNRPLYDPSGVFFEFARQNQQWVLDFGRSFPSDVIQNSEKKIFFVSSPPRFFFKTLNRVLRSVQLLYLKRNPLAEYKLPGAKIILTETELRFHPKPKNTSFHP